MSVVFRNVCFVLDCKHGASITTQMELSFPQKDESTFETLVSSWWSKYHILMTCTSNWRTKIHVPSYWQCLWFIVYKKLIVKHFLCKGTKLSQNNNLLLPCLCNRQWLKQWSVFWAMRSKLWAFSSLLGLDKDRDLWVRYGRMSEIRGDCITKSCTIYISPVRSCIPYLCENYSWDLWAIWTRRLNYIVFILAPK